MKMISKIQNSSWHDFRYLRSRKTLTPNVSNIFSSDGNYMRSRSWRYQMQLSFGRYSAPWLKDN